MRRWHTNFADGVGVCAEKAPGHPAYPAPGQVDSLREDEAGYWVLYNDAILASNTSATNAYANGYKAGKDVASHDRIGDIKLTAYTFHQAEAEENDDEDDVVTEWAFMEETDEAMGEDKQWVEYDEAVTATDISYLNGLAKGRAEGQTKLTAYQEVDKKLPTWSGFKDSDPPATPINAIYLDNGYDDNAFQELQRLVGEQADRIAARDDDDKTKKQLINELYHDRARLERVIANMVKLLKDGAQAVRITSPSDGHVSAAQISAKFGQFVKDHGSEA